MRVADLIAYVNHDIDDAIRAGLIRPDDLPRDLVAALGTTLVGAHRHAGQGRRDGDACRGPDARFA